MRFRFLVFFFAFVLAAPAVLRAQEFRATISGVVSDPSGSPVPGATVVATEIRTGTTTRTVSGSTGGYTIPFLLPGDYTLRAEAKGFKTFVHQGLHLASGQHAMIDVHLQLGAISQSVRVVSNVPLVNTVNASTGQVITTKQVEDLPLDGRTPMMLAQLSVGVVATSNPSLVHPFDNNGAAAWSIGGTPSQVSELLLDGAPDEIWSGALAYSPPQDAVQEVTVDAFNTDAAYGHSYGGTANQILKQGTNGFHGSMYEFSQPSNLDANTFFNNRAGNPLSVTHFNQYGLTAGGPVFIPKVYNGKNKLFWFFAWENLGDSQPTTDLTTVPTAAERNGDLSALSALGSQYQIYNPYSGVLNGSTIDRQPFYCDASGNALPTNPNGTQTPVTGSVPCNVIPSSLISPIAQSYLKFYPQPTPGLGTSEGFDNFVNNNTSKDSFDNELGRLDWNMSDRSHLFFDVRHNYRLQGKNNYFGNAATGVTLSRENWGGTIDEVYTISPTTVADVRANWTYMKEIHGDPSIGFDPTSLGFPSYVASSAQRLQMPAIEFSGSCGSQTSFQCLGNTNDSAVPSSSYQIFGDVMKMVGNHELHFGVDLRQYRLDTISYGCPDGCYAFGTNWTNGPTSSSPAAPFGQDLADFLLGLPSNSGSSEYTVNSYGTFISYYFAGYLQDNWRLRSNLTLNLGIRFEHDTPYAESYGRTVNGFDTTSPSPIATAAEAAYALHPIAQLPASDFKVLGGLTFPNSSPGAVYSQSSFIASPRLGFAWTPGFLGHETVLRGGFGLYVSPVTVANLDTNGSWSSNPILNQEGFSASTPYVATTNNYLTPATTLSDPFPGGINAPVGSADGLGTFMGQNVAFLAPTVNDPYSMRWNFGIQRSLAANLLLEVDYIGNHANNIPVQTTQLNTIPVQYLSTLSSRDQTVINTLTATVANPFAGLLPGTSLNGSKTTVAQLLSAFPQFPGESGSGTSGVVMDNNTVGSSNFNALDVRVEKRFSHGLSIISNYMFSKLIERDTYLNATDALLENRISPFDHTNHFVFAFSYDLPFGRGQLVNLRSRWANEVFGGWVLNGIYTYQTGAPIDWNASDYVYLNQPLDLNNSETDQTLVKGKYQPLPAFNTAAFDTNSKQQFEYHIRTFSTTFPNLRAESINNFDSSILKNFNVTEGAYFQLRFEAFNTFNRPQFEAPQVNSPTSSSFGVINKQANYSRQIQLGARFVW